MVTAATHATVSIHSVNGSRAQSAEWHRIATRIEVFGFIDHNLTIKCIYIEYFTSIIARRVMFSFRASDQRGRMPGRI